MARIFFASGVGGGGGGGTGFGEFVHADFGTQDVAQGRYVGVPGWFDLMAKLATIQLGASPVIRCAYTTGPFVVPAAGKPPLGWDIRGGTFTSFYGASGSVVLDCTAIGSNVFDNLFGIGQGGALGSGAIILKVAPDPGPLPPRDPVINFSALPPMAAQIFVIGGGCAIDHSTTAGAFMKGPNTSTTMVLVSAASQQNTGLLPPITGPLLELGATDGAVGVQLLFGGLPDGWLAGGGATSGLLNIYDLNANANTDNIAVWCPGFTGLAPVTTFSFGKAEFVYYVPAVLADWSGIAPTSVADALDRIAAVLTPIP